MKIYIKNMLLVVALIIIASNINVLTVHAATQYVDTENNDSDANAQLITANSMTYANEVSGSTSLYRYVTGSLSDINDNDWYKVYLYSNRDNYFTITGNTGTLTIEMRNSNGVPTDEFIYGGMSTSNHVFTVHVNESGVYYIHLYHEINISSNYRFVIGYPEYHLSSYTYSFGTQTLPARREWQDSVDLSTIADIPDGAIGYKITLGGCTTSVCSDRLFTNDFYSGWVATRTGYSYNLPVTEASILQQEWGLRYESSNTTNKTITPQFTINYVYPDLPLDGQ